VRQQQGSVFDTLGETSEKGHPYVSKEGDLGVDLVRVTYPRCYINRADRLGIQADTRHGSQPDTLTRYWNVGTPRGQHINTSIPHHLRRCMDKSGQQVVGDNARYGYPHLSTSRVTHTIWRKWNMW
jgi:hypothetical protein